VCDDLSVRTNKCLAAA